MFYRLPLIFTPKKYIVLKLTIQRLRLAFVLIILSIVPSFAQSTKPTLPRAGGYWMGYFGDNKLSNRFGIHSELQLRSLFHPENMESVLARAGLNYYATSNVMLSGGYAYIYVGPGSEGVLGAKTSEHRIWQQLFLKQRAGFLSFDHRYRLEQRFVHNTTLNTNTTSHRLRYRFQTVFNLDALRCGIDQWFVVANSEVFLNLKKDPSRIFDRNRLFVGLGYHINPRMNIQCGYLNQYAQTAGSTTPVKDHVFMLNFFATLDFRK